MVRDENLDFWVQNNYNVLFVGHAGVGKTSIVTAAFKRNNLNHRYFSASTMDPWVDLVGVPKERIDEDGNAYLDLIRPRGLDQVEAIFFDEFNRSNKKVRNACMELLQFKTINGRPFPNLKIIWAAINPDEDDTYDVEKLDPAQKDRFQIYVDIPYKADRVYFASKYGQETSRSAISWWEELPDEVRQVVSPRRLDYALDVFSKNGDIRFVLPEESNVSKLLTTLKHGPIIDVLERLYKQGDREEAKKWLASENNYQASIDYIKKSKPKSQFFLPLVNAERLSTLAADVSMLRFMLRFCCENEIFAKVISDIHDADQNQTAVSEIKKFVKDDREVAEALGIVTQATYRQWPLGVDTVPPYSAPFGSNNYGPELPKMMAEFRALGGTPIIRKKMYKYIVEQIPSKLTVDECLNTLKCLDAIAVRSQVTTLQKLDNFIGIVNKCFEQLYKNNGMTVPQIVKKYSASNFRSLWKKIRTDKEMSSGIILYGGQTQEVA